jgi:DNA topoisomerase-1
VAGLGRYGPFVLHEGTYANLESIEDVFTIGINRAVTLIAEKKAGAKGRFQRAKPAVLADLGEHPDGGKIEVLSGRYGPYLSHNKVNANVPKDRDPASVTREEAIELLAARAAKGGKAPRKSAKPKTAGAKTAASKSANGSAKTKSPRAKSKAEAET